MPGGSRDRDRLAIAGELLADSGHECNNQLAYLLSNLQNLVEYADDLARVLGAYRARMGAIGLVDDEIKKLEVTTDLDFLLEDLGRAAREGLTGATRLRDILRILGRLCEDETGEGPVIELGRVVRDVMGLHAKAISMRAQLVVEAELLGNVNARPSLLTRALVVMVRHGLECFAPHAPAGNVFKLTVERREDKLAVVIERTGGAATTGTAGLELALEASAQLGAELVVAPMGTTLLLPEAE